MTGPPGEVLLEEDPLRGDGVAEEAAAGLARGWWRRATAGGVACFALSGIWWGLYGTKKAPPSNLGLAVQAQKRRQCDVMRGKDVMGDRMASKEESNFVNQTAEGCRDLCERARKCGCYAWDASRNSTCWLKKGECDRFYEWDETPDMESGKCTADVPAPVAADDATPAPTRPQPQLQLEAGTRISAPAAEPPQSASFPSNGCTLVEGKAVDGETLKVKVPGSTVGECHAACEGRADCGCFEFSSGESRSQCLLKKSPCGSLTDAGKPDGRAAGYCQICDPCTPRDPVVLDVVILFYERDMCKMRMTAGSISAHDPGHRLGNVHLIWLSTHPPRDFQSDLDDIVRAANESHSVQLYDLSYIFEQSQMPGWNVQQIVKLKASAVVEAPFYVVLDAKNTFIRDVEPNTFVSVCNTGLVYATTSFDGLGEEKQGWYHKAAEALDTSLPERERWPGSTTPVVMHTQTVRDMLGHINEGLDIRKLCDGPLCGYIQSGATEFTLYYLYAAMLTDEKCVHYTAPYSPAAAFWRGVRPDAKEGLCNWVAYAESEGLKMFGAQAGALDDMPEHQRQKVAGCVAYIYSVAGLHDREQDSDESLLDCVLGG